MKIKGVDNQG